MPFTKDNKKWNENILFRIGSIIGCIALGIMILAFLFALPYIICKAQIIITSLPFFTESIPVEHYVTNMLTIFNCCIMASLSYFAYCLSKRENNMNREMREIKKMLWTTRIKKAVKDNRAILIREMGTVDFNRLKVDDSAVEDMISLRNSGVLTHEEYKLLEGYIDKVKKIKEEFLKGNEKKVEGLKKDFMSMYMNESDETDYKEDLQEIVNKLDKISKGEKEC